MKSPLLKPSLYIATLGMMACSFPLHADSLTVEGDLNVEGKVGIGTNTPTEKLEVDGNVKITGGSLVVDGDVGIEGSALTLGVRSDSTTEPGLHILYSDAAAPSIYLSATRNNATWLWQRDGGKTQMILDGANKLQLFNQASPSVVGITLDPSGMSIFSGPVQFSGNAVFNGEEISATSIAVSGQISAGEVSASKIYIADGVEIGNVLNGMNIGRANSIYLGGGGIAIGDENTIGPSAGPMERTFWGVSIEERNFVSGDVRNELAAVDENGFGLVPYPYVWSRAVTNLVFSGSSITFEIDQPVPSYALLDVGNQRVDVSYTDVGGGRTVVSLDLAVVPQEEQLEVIEYITSNMTENAAFWSFSAEMGSELIPAYLTDIEYADGYTSFSVSIGPHSDPISAGFLRFNSTAISAHGVVVLGSQNTATAHNGLAVGIGNNVEQDENTTTPASSGAFGYRNTVKAEGAYAFGSGITNLLPYTVQVGATNGGKVTISSWGGVGIGTENPQDMLHVVGGTWFSGNARVSGIITASKLRIPESGDLSMGDFRSGAVPAP